MRWRYTNYNKSYFSLISFPLAFPSRSISRSPSVHWHRVFGSRIFSLSFCSPFVWDLIFLLFPDYLLLIFIITASVWEKKVWFSLHPFDAVASSCFIIIIGFFFLVKYVLLVELAMSKNGWAAVVVAILENRARLASARSHLFVLYGRCVVYGRYTHNERRALNNHSHHCRQIKRGVVYNCYKVSKHTMDDGSRREKTTAHRTPSLSPHSTMETNQRKGKWTKRKQWQSHQRLGTTRQPTNQQQFINMLEVDARACEIENRTSKRWMKKKKIKRTGQNTRSSYKQKD